MVAPEPRRSAGDTLFEVSPLDFGPMPSLQARAVRSVVFGCVRPEQGEASQLELQMSTKFWAFTMFGIASYNLTHAMISHDMIVESCTLVSVQPFSFFPEHIHMLTCSIDETTLRTLS